MKNHLRLLPLLAIAASTSAGSSAAKTAPAAPLQYQTDPVSLLGGKVNIQASPSLRYLSAAESRRVIVDLWGNPPAQADDVLGMLVPGGTEPDTRHGWAIVVTENKDGHVSDQDAASTNYTQLMSNMQSGVEGGNAERKKAGYEPIKLIGWAEPPSYDAANHKMIWAKELAFGDAGAGDHTLNYAVRVLGRDDVLELNAVGAVSQLAQIKQGMSAVLPLVAFAPGSRYTDYKQGSDKLAAYGIAGLVAGGLAAKKLGLLALLPLLIKKGGILIVLLLGVLARLRGFFQRLLGRRSNTGQPTPVAAGPSVVSTPPFVHPDLVHRQGTQVDLSKPGDSKLGDAGQDRPAGRHGGEY